MYLTIIKVLRSDHFEDPLEVVVEQHLKASLVGPLDLSSHNNIAHSLMNGSRQSWDLSKC